MTATTIPGGHCRDCRHWMAVDERDADLQRPCAMTLRDDDEPAQPTSLAIAQDYECYRAWLTTAADFGCVQFERNE